MKSNHLSSRAPYTPFLTRMLLGTSGLHYTALAGLLSLALFASATAADFSGSLKGVTITDVANTNKPPVAAFTYFINGNAITFDANGSTDPDGSVTKYKWDFGDGTTAEGATATYTLNTSNLHVTLTVVDNQNGAALSQQAVTVASTSTGITDDFSTDTSGNYTNLTGGLINVYNGAAHSSGAWITIYAIHNTELQSRDHYVEADVYYNGTGTGGLMLRMNKPQNTGYVVSFESGRISLKKFNSGKEDWLTFFDGKYAAGVYRLKAEISGNIINIYINGQLVLTTTDNTYPTGNYVGFKIDPYGNNALITVDNFNGK